MCFTPHVIGHRSCDKNQPSQNSVTIKNLGQLDERFFRGGQPKDEEYKELAALGIKTVIDLRNDPKDYAEDKFAEALGMRYINIPDERQTVSCRGEG